MLCFDFNKYLIRLYLKPIRHFNSSSSFFLDLKNSSRIVSLTRSEFEELLQNYNLICDAWQKIRTGNSWSAAPPTFAQVEQPLMAAQAALPQNLFHMQPSQSTSQQQSTQVLQQNAQQPWEAISWEQAIHASSSEDSNKVNYLYIIS